MKKMQKALLKQKKPVTGKNSQVLIRASKLCKYFGKNGEIKAVDDLDLEIHEGETFGLLGPTLFPAVSFASMKNSARSVLMMMSGSELLPRCSPNSVLALFSTDQLVYSH